MDKKEATNEQPDKTFYTKLITSIINENKCFLRSSKKIRWGFTSNEDIHIFATYRRKEDIVCINLLAVKDAIAKGTTLDIEYFLMHEIRHMFQQEEIDDFLAGKETVIDKEIISKWIDENRNYHAASPNVKGGLESYFGQDSEIDAYAYSYAIMEYKYGAKEAKKLYTPEFNKDLFIELKDEWVKEFAEEHIPRKSKQVS